MVWFTLRKFAGLLLTVGITAWLIHAVLAPAPAATPIAPGLAGWLGQALIGDFGASARGPAGGLIAARLAVTVPLALLALILSAAIGAGLGWLAALRPGSIADRLLGGLARVGVAAPNFWLGMLLVPVFATGLHWLPPGGFVPWHENAGAALLSLLLPALALALPAGAALAIGNRDAIAGARGSAYVRAARAQGMSADAAFRRDGLPVAALAAARIAIPQGAAIVFGTVIVENVFYLPGLGRLILDGVAARDVALVGGALLVLMLLGAGTTFLLQLAVAWADPRNRAGAGA